MNNIVASDKNIENTKILINTNFVDGIVQMYITVIQNIITTRIKYPTYKPIVFKMFL